MEFVSWISWFRESFLDDRTVKTSFCIVGIPSEATVSGIGVSIIEVETFCFLWRSDFAGYNPQ